MPSISRFFGIVIAVYYNDHAPAHFHARYGDWEVVVVIDTLEVLEGNLPRRAFSLVLEWAALHRDELRANWVRARRGATLVAVEPLE